MMTNRCFWKTVKPFLNSKGDHGQQTVTSEENDKIHENPTNIAEILNDYFVNIVEIILVNHLHPITKKSIFLKS